MYREDSGDDLSTLLCDLVPVLLWELPDHAVSAKDAEQSGDTGATVALLPVVDVPTRIESVDDVAIPESLKDEVSVVDGNEEVEVVAIPGPESADPAAAAHGARRRF